MVRSVRTDRELQHSDTFLFTEQGSQQTVHQFKLSNKVIKDYYNMATED